MFVRIALLASLLFPLTLFSQTLADKIPSDAVLYIGWKGADTLGGEYEQSHLKAVLDATDLSSLDSVAFAKGLANAVGRTDPKFARELPGLLSAARQLRHYPTALYLSRTPQGMPIVAVVSDAGDQSAPLAGQLKTALLGQPAVQITVQDNLLILSSGPVNIADSPAAATPFSALSASPSFQAAMKEVDPKGVCVVYCNIESAMAWMHAASPSAGQADQAKAFAALGLDTVKFFAASGNFAGQDFATRIYLAAPAPRKGMLKLLDGGPLSLDTLKLVPQSATFVSAGSFDLAGFLDETRQSLQSMDPGMAQQYDQGLAKLTMMSGVNLRSQLAASLGKQWVAYGDPATVGNSIMGWVFVNRPSDPAVAEAALVKLENSLAAFAKSNSGSSHMTLPVYRKQFGNTTVHCFALPLVSPSWAIRDGVLYMGFYPQSIIAAADFVASGKPSFATHQRVIAMKGTLPAGLTYYDLPRTAPGAYGFVIALSRYAGFADLFGIPTPIVAIPPLPTLLANLSPSLTTSWSDASGWHMQGTSPFPGSELLAGNFEANTSMFQVPLVASILLPSLAKARETANRVKCASNLRQIGMAEMMYANENRGKFAPDLQTLLKAHLLSPQVFICPAAPAAAMHQEGGAPCAYVYVGKTLTINAASEAVIAYEPIECHGGQGANFLWGDCHVTWENDATAQSIIDALKAGHNPPQQ